MCAAQRRSDGAQLLSHTHPGLVEAVGVPVILEVLLLLGLLELVPQPLYPVVVTGSHLTAGRERDRGGEIVGLGVLYLEVMF